MKRSFLTLAVIVGCNGSSGSGNESAPPVATSTLVKPAVAWPAASSVDARAYESLGDARSQVARSPVPVLVPSADIARDRAPTLIVEDEYYAVTIHSHGASINVQGTRIAHAYANIDPHPGNRPLRGGRGFVTENEGIRTASFVENGVAYSVDVECATSTDARCTGDAFVTELTEGLAFVGGSSR